MGFESVYDLASGIAAWDGDIVSAAVASTTPPDPGSQTSGLPVLYEFYTDW